MKQKQIVTVFGLIIVAMFIQACVTTTNTAVMNAVRQDYLGRTESYGYVVLEKTTIYDTAERSHVIGELPKWYNFRYGSKNDIKFDNGLVFLPYYKGDVRDYIPYGWVNLNDVRIFSNWEYPMMEGVRPQGSSATVLYPVTAAKATEVIYEMDREKKPWDKKFTEAIGRSEAILGMTPEMVLLAYGEPDKINQNPNGKVVTTQWVYAPGTRKTNYVYFKDGVVVDLQDLSENTPISNVNSK